MHRLQRLRDPATATQRLEGEAIDTTILLAATALQFHRRAAFGRAMDALRAFGPDRVRHRMPRIIMNPAHAAAIVQGLGS